jgi:hypothetical protein
MTSAEEQKMLASLSPVCDLGDELHQFPFHDLLVDLRRLIFTTRTGSAF